MFSITQTLRIHAEPHPSPLLPHDLHELDLGKLEQMLYTNNKLARVHADGDVEAFTLPSSHRRAKRTATHGVTVHEGAQEPAEQLPPIGGGRRHHVGRGGHGEAPRKASLPALRPSSRGTALNPTSSEAWPRPRFESHGARVRDTPGCTAAHGSLICALSKLLPDGRASRIHRRLGAGGDSPQRLGRPAHTCATCPSGLPATHQHLPGRGLSRTAPWLLRLPLVRQRKQTPQGITDT